MKAIPLNHGKFTIVDDDDYPLLSKLKWRAMRCNDIWYAVRTGTLGKKKIAIEMHRVILGFPGTDIDHRDRDGLNNTRNNLRVATRGENRANSRVSKRSKSGFKGVWMQNGKWVAKVRHNGRVYCFGTFTDAKEASDAYIDGARKHFGEFARAN
jgi:hypothetical protein